MPAFLAAWCPLCSWRTMRTSARSAHSAMARSVGWSSEPSSTITTSYGNVWGCWISDSTASKR